MHNQIFNLAFLPLKYCLRGSFGFISISLNIDRIDMKLCTSIEKQIKNGFCSCKFFDLAHKKRLIRKNVKFYGKYP